MKKKIVSLALAVVLALSLCACANKEAGNTAAWRSVASGGSGYINCGRQQCCG